eukprot:215726-Pelagomonas_calceolata.AAC.1
MHALPRHGASKPGSFLAAHLKLAYTSNLIRPAFFRRLEDSQVMDGMCHFKREISSLNHHYVGLPEALPQKWIQGSGPMHVCTKKAL